jgi:hypothetical protein
VTEGTLRVVGSDAALPLVRAAADTFVAYYKRAQVTVEGGGSVAGLEALINKNADIAVLSREPLASERQAGREVGVDIALYPFAYDGLALIVHRDNPVYALSFSEARALFSGQTTDWAAVGGSPGWIRVYTTGNGATAFVGTRSSAGPSHEGGTGHHDRGRRFGSVSRCGRVREHGQVDDHQGLPNLPRAAQVLDGDSLPEGVPLVRTFLSVRGPADDLVSGRSFVMSNRKKIVAEGIVPPGARPLPDRGAPAVSGTDD